MKWIQQVKALVVKKAKAALHAAKSAAVKVGVVAAVGVSVGLSSVQAYAATTVDLSSITGAVSSADIATGVLAIGAVMAVAYMTIKATKIVLGVLKTS